MSDFSYLFDIFDDEIKSVGKALLLFSALFYMSERTDKNNPFRRDDVRYAIDAYLPQVYDRSIINARASQRITKTLIIKFLQIDHVKNQLRLATDRETKLKALSELFILSLAGILSAAHMHSLSIMLHVIKNMTLALVFVLRKREIQQNSHGNSAMVSKLRSWWSDGLQSVIMQSIVENLKQQTEGSLFTQLMDENNIEIADEKRSFSVEALLQMVIPIVVNKALNIVRNGLNKQPSHMFHVTAMVTGKDMHKLLRELSVDFESCVVWSDWLTSSSSSLLTMGGITSLQSTQSVLLNGNNHDNRKVGMSFPHSESGEDICSYPAGSTAVLHEDYLLLQRQRDREIMDNIFGPMMSEKSEEREAREEAVRCEELARRQAANFFNELIHSAAFNELCIAHAGEMLEYIINSVTDLSGVSSYDISTDSARMPQVITLVENYRLKVFDEEFEVPSYLQLFCAETIRATCCHP